MRDPQIGDESWPGQVLIELVDLAALQARVYVLERDAGSLAKDRGVVVRLDSIPEKVYQGTVRNVAALAQALERNSPLKYFICDVSITNAGEDLKRIKPGMSLKAEVILEKYDSCFVVPAGAVTTKGADTLVYVQQGNKFVPRPVTDRGGEPRPVYHPGGRGRGHGDRGAQSLRDPQGLLARFQQGRGGGRGRGWTDDDPDGRPLEHSSIRRTAEKAQRQCGTWKAFG